MRKLIRQRGGDRLLETEVYRLRELVWKLQKNKEDGWPSKVNNNLLSGDRPTQLIRCLLFSTFFITMSSFRIASLSKWSKGRKEKEFALWSPENKTNCHCFYPRMHSNKDIKVEWQRELGGQLVFSHLSSASGGVAILFSSKILTIYFDYEEVVKSRLQKSHCKIWKKHNSVFKYLLTSFPVG